MLEVRRSICVWGDGGECVWCWWGMRVLLHGKVLQAMRGLLMWGASTIDGACVCNCPISYTRMPHQQQMRPTSTTHTHPTAPHHAAKHACLISTTRTPHQHPMHIYTYTLLTLRCDILTCICILNIKTYRLHGTSLTHIWIAKFHIATHTTNKYRFHYILRVTINKDSNISDKMPTNCEFS